ncbi:hypothetical protein KC221_23905, partial [Mycobacterium tuberculosis]|nr:hypothetical protein [Mycobacterium tuberculosis]
MTGAAATFFGQQSAMYRAAFAMEKAYAVYKAVMNIRETYSNTYTLVEAILVIGPDSADQRGRPGVGTGDHHRGHIRHIGRE